LTTAIRDPRPDTTARICAVSFAERLDEFAERDGDRPCCIGASPTNVAERTALFGNCDAPVPVPQTICTRANGPGGTGGAGRVAGDGVSSDVERTPSAADPLLDLATGTYQFSIRGDTRAKWDALVEGYGPAGPRRLVRTARPLPGSISPWSCGDWFALIGDAGEPLDSIARGHEAADLLTFGPLSPHPGPPERVSP